MNAKEEVIDILKYIKETSNNDIDYLITAVENAIFDVPSEKEIRAEIKRRMLNRNQTLHFSRGINYILNYKKPESDGK